MPLAGSNPVGSAKTPISHAAGGVGVFFAQDHFRSNPLRHIR